MHLGAAVHEHVGTELVVGGHPGQVCTRFPVQRGLEIAPKDSMSGLILAMFTTLRQIVGEDSGSPGSNASPCLAHGNAPLHSFALHRQFARPRPREWEGLLVRMMSPR